MSESLPVIVDEGRFEAEVLAAPGLVLVGFCADWSGACHLMMPVVEAVARKLDGSMKVILVDIDRASALKARYGVESVPTWLFFTGGQPVEQVVGTVSRTRLTGMAESLLQGGG